ncbi:MAG: exonuclease domain-containing protein [Chloroflexi bacterium]|nr:exonuclease domain-containing protein [Chloroflexota bacterium]
MAYKLDQIVVIDIEATCWKQRPPDGQVNEIIEIGICTLDVATGERAEKESILVKPERSTISKFCTELTTLTPEQVEQDGISFKKACQVLRKKYHTRRRTWASYGNYDRQMFERQCAARRVEYPFGATHLNIKNLFAIMMGLKHEIGLVQAIETLRLEMEGTHHRGHDDAWNTALLLARILRCGKD